MNIAKWLIEHTGNFLTGLLATVFGYFSPVTGVINVMVAAILFDLITGIFAARKRGKGIKSFKLWTTVKKLFLSVALIALLYAIDLEIGIVETHRIIAWLIIGFEIWSILENSAFIVDHKAFYAVQKFMEDKVRDTTGVDISEQGDTTPDKENEDTQ